MILIITASTDAQADAVVGLLNTPDVVRLDLAQTPPNYYVSAGFDSKTNRQTYQLFHRGQTIDLAKVSVVWWRTPGPASLAEADSVLADILTAIDVFWLNRPNREEEAERLTYQLATARELGFALPDTCITGDEATALKFIRVHGRENIVRRTFSVSERKWLQTELPQKGIGPIGTNAPIILQERPAGIDFRVTLLGDRITTDIQGPDVFGKERWERLKADLGKFGRRLGLGYCTVNLRLSAGENDPVFLDINPLGEWAAFDAPNQKRIAGKVADILVRRSAKPARGPLGEIALSLSGGGYRAAAFHLGAMEMLDELGVLADVTRLSTASGGTITAAKYLYEMDKDPDLPFGEFKKRLKSFLANTNVITEAIVRLDKTSTIDGRHLMPSLSRATADVYADLVDNTTLGGLLASNRKIKEIFLNSTNFHTATSFRFEIKDEAVKLTTPSVEKDDGKPRTPETVEERQRRQAAVRSIRLADVIAASACFPGGLEPIYFPTDFRWQAELKEVREDLGPAFAKDVPLMDGGIFDNQGIDSIKLSLSRIDSSTDLFIISDSSARNPRIFGRKPNLTKSRFKLWIAVTAIALVLLAAFSSVITIGYAILSRLWLGDFGWDLLLYYVPPFLAAATIGAVTLFGLYKIWPSWPVINGKIGNKKGWAALARLSVPDLIELISSRVLSVMSLVLSIFLRRIRSTGFTSVFSDADLNQRLLANLIYDIDEPERWKKRIPEKFHPLEAVQHSVRAPEHYPTTLDFDGKNKHFIDDLVELGRCTMCFNILRYLYQFKSAEIRTTGSPLSGLARDVEEKWMECNR